jgi:hypothetical protein
MPAMLTETTASTRNTVSEKIRLRQLGPPLRQLGPPATPGPPACAADGPSAADRPVQQRE